MPKGQLLNERMLKFIGAYNGPGSGTEAARIAGYGQPQLAAARLVKHPGVVAALKKKQDEVIKASGKKLGRAITITRNDIVMGLVDEAKGADSASARVSAWSKLADIFRITDKTKDADLFDGWTDEELVEYRDTGRLPARFGLSPDSDDSHPPNSDPPVN